MSPTVCPHTKENLTKAKAKELGENDVIFLFKDSDVLHIICGAEDTDVPTPLAVSPHCVSQLCPRKKESLSKAGAKMVVQNDFCFLKQHICESEYCYCFLYYRNRVV